MTYSKCVLNFGGEAQQIKEKFIGIKSWSRLCAPKERGGLGFRDLQAFNLALLAKQGWRVLENPESLISCMYIARYFPDFTFWDAPAPIMSSFSWRSILASKEVLRRGIRWQIGWGTEVCTWFDP